MVELVLIVCLMTAQGEACLHDTESVLETVQACDAAGRIASQRLLLNFFEHDLSGRAGWVCRKAGTPL